MGGFIHSKPGRGHPQRPTTLALIALSVDRVLGCRLARAPYGADCVRYLAGRDCCAHRAAATIGVAFTGSIRGRGLPPNRGTRAVGTKLALCRRIPAGGEARRGQYYGTWSAAGGQLRLSALRQPRRRA